MIFMFGEKDLDSETELEKNNDFVVDFFPNVASSSSVESPKLPLHQLMNQQTSLN